MTTFEELDALSSAELHDRAFGHAERHLDVGFFYRLLQQIPAAAAEVADEPGEATADIFHLTNLVRDFFRTDEGELADALRPFYIDYLLANAG